MQREGTSDERFMQAALQMAVLGHPSPNPYVGAIIVKDDKIIGSGYHKKAGEAHAEREAIKDAMNKNGEKAVELLRDSTLYVNLEPCNHIGKTPPCTEAITKSGIKKVVVATRDVNEEVEGGGIEKLKKNGIEIVEGVLEQQAKGVNAAYIRAKTCKMPLVTLKMAMSLDGKTATESGDSKWITGEKKREVVMKMRDKADAILVGVDTVLKDNQRLTARGSENFVDPLRVVVDSSLKVSGDERIFDDSNVLIAHTNRADRAKIEKMREKKIELLECKMNGEKRVDLQDLLKKLVRRGINQVLCEGGATLADSLRKAGLIDVMILGISPKIIGGMGRPLFEGEGVEKIEQAQKGQIVNAMMLGDDLMLVVNLK